MAFPLVAHWANKGRLSFGSASFESRALSSNVYVLQRLKKSLQVSATGWLGVVDNRV